MNDGTLSFDVGGLDNSEAREALWRVSRQNVVKILVWWAIVFVALVGVAIAWRSAGIFTVGMSLLLCLVGASGLWVTVEILIKGARLARKSNADPTKYEISSDMFAFSGRDASLNCSWSLFDQFAVTKRLFLVHMKGSKAWLIIPKRCLSEGQVSALLALLPASATPTHPEPST